MKPIPPTPPKQFIKKALILKEFTNLDIPIDEFEKINLIQIINITLIYACLEAQI